MKSYLSNLPGGDFMLPLYVSACLFAPYAATCSALYLTQDYFIYPGAFFGLAKPAKADAVDAYMQRVSIHGHDDVPLEALYHAPSEGMPTVMLFHGNAGSPYEYGFLYKRWLSKGYGILAPTYRGYPGSGGRATERDILADSLSLYDWLLKQSPSASVFVMGQSLGTACAVHVAARRDVSGVILVSPFMSMVSLVSSKFPWVPVGFLLSSRFASDKDMPEVKAPVLVFHGDQDEIVPISSGRSLAALARNSQFVEIPGAGHVNGLFRRDMIHRIDAFLSSSSERPAP